MRSFEFARKMVDGVPAIEPDEKGVMGEVRAFPNAQLPEYQTKYSAAADFFCAEEVVIPSIWHSVFNVMSDWLGYVVKGAGKHLEGKTYSDEERSALSKLFAPTLVHTGIKSNMATDEVLYIYNRSSGPKKLGLILANSVGVIDSDYYESRGNDGEIMFGFINIKPWSVKIKVGDRIGQGLFQECRRPEVGLRVKDEERVGGVGSTGQN